MLIKHNFPQQILNLWNSKGINFFFLSVEPQEHNIQSHSLVRNTVFSLVHTWFLVVLRSFGTIIYFMGSLPIYFPFLCMYP